MDDNVYMFLKISKSYYYYFYFLVSVFSIEAEKSIILI